jgi:hypothetical protein
MADKLSLIHEQTSPLFRIMWVFNYDDPKRKSFTNNICAFHTGNGNILTVAHNLRSEAGVVNSLDEAIFQSQIASHLQPAQSLLMQLYTLDPATNKRYLNIGNNNPKFVIDTLRQVNFDTRWISMYEKKICRPFLIIQFNNDRFYDDDRLTGFFNASTSFYESSLNRHTFLIELELAETYYSNDIAQYKIINTDISVIDRLPFIEPDFSIQDDTSKYYCLQSAPVGNLGRLLNNATIEGFLDHHAIYQDRIGGNYTVEGLRYLIKGYFRFGSSGAPYVFHDGQTFKVNAIQSEASPIQLSINNSRDGNFQYVNAIASPLKNIEKQFLQSQEKLKLGI